MQLDASLQYFIYLVPLFLLVTGLLCVVFWSKKTEFDSVLWLGLSTAFNGGAIFWQSATLMQPPVHWYSVMACLYICNYACFSQAVLLRLNLRQNFRVFLLLTLLMLLATTYFSVLQQSLVGRLTSYAFAVMLLMSVNCVQIYRAYRTGTWHILQKCLMWGYFFCTLIFVGRVLLLIQFYYQDQAALLNFNSMSHWFINQIFILVLTLFFVAVIIATHFYQQHIQQIAHISQAKQQERVYLSQDLHDTLGSSLVRSIGVMSNQQHVSSDQVLSMLKLLRDDLRQVIDHNTHDDGTAIPESPIAWGAPIRHRFSQVFEALGISCTWYFDAEWQQKPSALQCVSLRRISEEALTNIIKHSQATQVSLQLQQFDNQLQLCIQDNGIGFDLSQTQNGNVNVGLKSMQQRAISINAHLDICSNQGNTCITVTLQNQTS